MRGASPKFAVPLILAFPCLAADISGKWAGYPGYVVLQQQGESLTGTAGPSAHDQVPIPNGRVDGDRVTFSMGPYRFVLQISEDQLKGEMTGDSQQVAVVLKRTVPAQGGEAPRFKTAYDLKDYQLHVPEWMHTEPYDIAATMPAGTEISQLQRMMQSMLADHFRLVLHHETKEVPVYALVTDSAGPKLKEVEWARGSTSGGPGRIEAHSIRMTNLEEILSREVDRQVFDFSGLKGLYDFTLRWTPDRLRGQVLSDTNHGLPPKSIGDSDTSDPSIFAVREQLGYRELTPASSPAGSCPVWRRSGRSPSGRQSSPSATSRSCGMSPTIQNGPALNALWSG
jgi:uncharacterized protein (TIGR03435 family)